jgi:hypothetical protein
MNLDYVLIGSDMNPYYYDFWPLLSKIWKEKFNVTPILGLICDEYSELEETEYGYVKKFKKIEGIDVGLQTQIVRFFLSKFLNGKCIISDIDMFPLSKSYFEESTRNLTDKNFIILSSDNPECLKDKMYPMCYVAGHSTVFGEIFDLHLTWIEFCELLHNRNQTWYTDQKYLYEKVNHYHKITNNCIFLNRGWNGPAIRRIDRVNWSYDPLMVNNGYYYDSHVLRPYSKYKDEIIKLTNLL